MTSSDQTGRPHLPVHFEDLGEKLLALGRDAESHVILVSPFVKYRPLEGFIATMRDHVSLELFTTWEPHDVALGVSDTETIELILARPRSNMWICPALHAKLYMSDKWCLLGSANLTNAGMGFVRDENLELMIETQPSSQGLDAFLTELRKRSVPADEGMRARVDAAARLIEVTPHANRDTGRQPTSTHRRDFCRWLPELRRPEQLYVVYQGESDAVTSPSLQAAQSDLAAFAPPAGLSREAFGALIACRMLQHPTIRDVDTMLGTPQRFGAVVDFLDSTEHADAEPWDADRAWQTLMRWLLHFMPERYQLETPHISEIMRRV